MDAKLYDLLWEYVTEHGKEYDCYKIGKISKTIDGFISEHGSDVFDQQNVDEVREVYECVSDAYRFASTLKK